MSSNTYIKLYEYKSIALEKLIWHIQFDIKKDCLPKWLILFSRQMSHLFCKRHSSF